MNNPANDDGKDSDNGIDGNGSEGNGNRDKGNDDGNDGDNKDCKGNDNDNDDDGNLNDDNESSDRVMDDEVEENEDGEDVDFEFDNGDIELVSESDEGSVSIGSFDTIESNEIVLVNVGDEGNWACFWQERIALYSREIINPEGFNLQDWSYERRVTGVPLESVTDTVTLTEHHCCSLHVIVYNDVRTVTICARPVFHQNPKRCRHASCCRPDIVIGEPGRYRRFPRHEIWLNAVGETDQTFHSIVDDWTPRELSREISFHRASLVPFWEEYFRNRNFIDLFIRSC